MLVLSGILVMIVGLAMRFNALLVVIVAGFVTGFAAGMTPLEIVGVIGEAFIKNRYMSLFILVLPVIGMAERFGLREHAEHLIAKLSAVTAGRIFLLYMFIRQVTVALGIALGGHPSMIRPLISPMGEAAALKGRPASQEILDKIRAMAASSENYGNFFAQNIFIASGGILLIKGVFEAAGYNVDLGMMALYSIPTAIITFIVAAVRYFLFDATIEKEIKKYMETIGE